MELFGEKLTEKNKSSILDDSLVSACTSGHVRQHKVVGKEQLMWMLFCVDSVFLIFVSVGH